MGHVNAGLEFLIAVFNDMWPLVLATFAGAWMAFQHHRHQENRKDIEARNRAIKYTCFVITSQTDKLVNIYDAFFVGKKTNPNRALQIDPVVIHDDFPGLDMTSLPAAFEGEEYKLMNQTTEAEQEFTEIVELLKSRAARLSALEHLKPESEGGRQRKQSIEQSLGVITDKLYAKLEATITKNTNLIEALKRYIRDSDARVPGALVDYSAWYFLAAAGAVAGVFFFSHWAINSRALLNSGLDITLVSAVVFAVSLYASLAIGIIVAVLSIFSLTKKLKSFSVYFWTFLISLQPMVFLLWLDVS